MCRIYVLFCRLVLVEYKLISNWKKTVLKQLKNEKIIYCTHIKENYLIVVILDFFSLSNYNLIYIFYFKKKNCSKRKYKIHIFFLFYYMCLYKKNKINQLAQNAEYPLGLFTGALQMQVAKPARELIYFFDIFFKINLFFSFVILLFVFYFFESHIAI